MKTKKFGKLAITTIVILVSIVLQGQESFSSSVTITPVADTYISEEQPGVNFGTENYLIVGWTTPPYTPSLYRWANIVRFDLSSIPTSCTINTASFCVYNILPPGIGYWLNLHNLYGAFPFSETGATWNNTNGQYESTILDTSFQGTTAGWRCFNNISPKVQQWIVDPGLWNSGLMVRADPGDWPTPPTDIINDVHCSREYSPSGLRPYLTINYNDCPTVAPTLISPSNGTTNQSLTPTLSWSSVPNATTYNVEVCSGSACPGGTSVYNNSSISGTSITVPSGTLSNSTTYYWRANSTGTASGCELCGWAAYSSSFSFTTLPPLALADLFDDGESGRFFISSAPIPTAIPYGVQTSFTVGTDIRNGGTTNAGTFRVNFYASTDTTISFSDYLIGGWTCGPITAGNYVNCDMTIIFPSDIPAGIYWIGWIIDNFNQVSESNESNNTAYKTGYQLTVEPPPTCVYTITSPNGGENWLADSTQNITWTKTGTTCDSTVYLFYSLDGGNNWTRINTTSAPNNGLYSWTVISSPTTQARVALQDTVVGDTGDANFTISNPSQSTGTISVTSLPSGASFNLSGIAAYSGVTPWSIFTAPVGSYTITWGLMTGYIAPLNETKTLTAGGSISFVGTYTFFGDSYEPNDTLSTAVFLNSGGDFNTTSPLIISNSDLDYFGIYPLSAGTITITMTPPTGKDYDLVLLDSLGNQVGYFPKGGDASETITYTVASGGTYYIYVYGYNGAFDTNNPYSLKYTFTPDSPPPPPPPPTTGGADSGGGGSGGGCLIANSGKTQNSTSNITYLVILAIPLVIILLKRKRIRSRY